MRQSHKLVAGHCSTVLADVCTLSDHVNQPWLLPQAVPVVSADKQSPMPDALLCLWISLEPAHADHRLGGPTDSTVGSDL